MIDSRAATSPSDPLAVHEATSLQGHDRIMPVLAPTPRPYSTLSGADMDRFATLFSPATPPATPILCTDDSEGPLALPTMPATRPGPAPARPRKSTQGSSDSDFGAFVSVPPAQDPLSHAPTPTGNHSTSLVYFDRFTADARTAADRQKREVLDELLRHQDDPLYFLHADADANADADADVDAPPTTSESVRSVHPVPVPAPWPMSTDDALAEALASEMTHPRLVRVDRGGSVRVAPSPVRARQPLPPRLSGSASPPSTSSPTGSTTSLPTTTSPPPSTQTQMQPAHATLARLSSSLVSLLPSGSGRSRAASASTSTSAPGPIARFHVAAAVTHGSPFASTPYIPPTGAPGFAGDRAWDRGFSEALAHAETHGLVDPVGLGIARTETTARPGGVALVGRREGTVRVLDEALADLVRPYLPALTRLPRRWTLLYSLDQHGISLNTLYARCAPRVPSRAYPNPPQGGLLVVRDARDAVFGAWLSEGVRLEKGGYYGCGESFLWRYHAPLDGDRQGRLDVFKWTGANAYVALCEPGFISFGGGDGHYGLYLDASLLEGSSAPCPTFGNPPLCAAAPHVSEERNGVVRAKGDVSFECVGLEVWGVGSG